MLNWSASDDKSPLKRNHFVAEHATFRLEVYPLYWKHERGRNKKGIPLEGETRWYFTISLGQVRILGSQFTSELCEGCDSRQEAQELAEWWLIQLTQYPTMDLIPGDECLRPKPVDAILASEMEFVTA